MNRRCAEEQRLSGPARRCRAGFTLLELLVVIAIIGTLMVVVSGGVFKFQQRARRTVTLGNLRHTAAAALQMAADRRGIIDLNESRGGYYQPYATLSRELLDGGYVSDRKYFFSAELDGALLKETLDPAFTGWTWRTMGVFRDVTKIPGWFSPLPAEGQSGHGTSGSALRLPALDEPSLMPLLIDTVGGGAGPAHINKRPHGWICWFGPNWNTWKPVMRDDKTVLMSFADGHAEAVGHDGLRKIIRTNFNLAEVHVVNSRGEAVAIRVQ